jgi:hypothetical protein
MSDEFNIRTELNAKFRWGISEDQKVYLFFNDGKLVCKTYTNYKSKYDIIFPRTINSRLSKIINNKEHFFKVSADEHNTIRLKYME